MNDKPIGIFDSGVGGLTAVRELRKLMPNENVIYFGDTGRVPYGSRSRETIAKFGSQAVNFLKKHDVKAIVAACGTISSTVDEKTMQGLCGDIPYTGVVMPATRTACAMSAGGRVGVIATPAAIRTGAYGRAVRSVSPGVKVFGNACPLLVPLAENGITSPDNKIARLCVEMYLEPLIREEIDTLILGCTHYPLLFDVISDVLEYKVTLIDSGACAAREMQSVLARQGLLNGSNEAGTAEYYVTDSVSVSNFENIAKTFLQEERVGKVSYVAVEEIDV